MAKSADPAALFVGMGAAGGACAWRSVLARAGMAVQTMDLHAWTHSKRQICPALILVGTCCGSNSVALDELRSVREDAPSTPILFYTSDGSEEVAVAALRLRASEYLRFPTDPAELQRALSRLVNNRPSGPTSEAAGPALVGQSYQMQEVRAYIEQVAKTDTNLLISGQTGTGKELVAELVHQNSNRSNKPMVSVNCAAIPDALLESELFGYERGAFTGAASRTEGKLRQAHTGTVFLDEIGDMSQCAQAKVLRALERKRIQRLGGSGDVDIDVRFIAATHQNLEHLVREGRFRADLYFRLNVARVELPPLQERKEDLPLLTAHAIGEFNQRFGREVRGLTDAATDMLMTYDWPGNVRELRNLLEACFITVRSSSIGVTDFPPYFRNRCDNGVVTESESDREKLIRTLVSTNWNKSRAARQLHWSRMTLYRKLTRYRIECGQPV